MAGIAALDTGLLWTLRSDPLEPRAGAFDPKEASALKCIVNSSDTDNIFKLAACEPEDLLSDNNIPADVLGSLLSDMVSLCE